MPDHASMVKELIKDVDVGPDDTIVLLDVIPNKSPSFIWPGIHSNSISYKL